VIIGHDTYQVQQDDMVIYSDAAAESPEVLAAHAKALHNHKRVFPPMSLFQFWGELSKYMQTIAIAGTHGKSTTTALTATALAQHHPKFGLGIVGAPVNQR
jgi:UDP-N-acetylmuramate--alanine ligase